MSRPPKRGGSPEDTVTVTVSRPGAATTGRARGAGQACLVCIYGAELGKRWALTGGTVTIGRSSSSDIPLDQDAVSRAHARITRRDDTYVVTDLGSTNGTFVGDELITERALNNGDRVRIGRTIIKFLSGGDVESSYHDEIYRLVTVDGLTQIYNRRYFNEAIDRELARTKRGRLPLSLIRRALVHRGWRVLLWPRPACPTKYTSVPTQTKASRIATVSERCGTNSPSPWVRTLRSTMSA